MQDINFETGVWAVITVSGGKKLIGSFRFTDDNERPKESNGDGVVEVCAAMANGYTAQVHQCFQLVDAVVPVQTPQGVAMSRIVQCMPIDNCLGPATVHTLLEGVHFFSSMQESDVERHKGLVRALMDQLVTARAEQAGLVLPNRNHGNHTKPT